MATSSHWEQLLKKPRAVYAWIPALVAAATYLLSLAPDVFPGDSASLVAQHSGIDPFAPLSHILWGWVGNLFALIPVGTLGFRWNLLSAVCGAACCGLVSLLVIRLVGTSKNWDETTSQPGTIRNLGGLVAGLLLAFCLPFRIVSTIAHPATFELLILLISIWSFVRFAETGSLRTAVISAALFGVSLSQYPTTILFAPLYVGFLAYVLWRHNMLRVGLSMKLLFVLAVSFCVVPLISAWLFSKKAGFHWADMKGIGEVLIYMARDMYISLRHGTPKVAITIVSLFSLLPFMVVVLIPRRRGSGSEYLLAVSLIIGGLLFFNIRFAPWPMFGFRPLLIMPYVIGAAWCGYLFAIIMGSLPLLWQIHYRLRRNSWVPEAIKSGGMLLILLFVAAAAVASHLVANTASSMAITRYADAVAGQVTSNTWLIIDNQMEPLVRIKACERGTAPQLYISAQRFGHRPYQNALVEQLDDARLGNMVRVGLIPLLRERLHPSRTNTPVVATMGDPTVIQVVAGKVFSDRVLFVSRLAEDKDAGTVMKELREVWQEIGDGLLESAEEKGPNRETTQRLLRVLSRSANDTGVQMEDDGFPELAREAYREAIRLGDENLSAFLNLQQLTPAEDPEFAALANRVEELSAALRGKFTLVQIMGTYGYIRHPDSYAADAARWSQIGSTETAAQILTKALKEHGDDEMYRMMMASLSARQGDADRSEALLTDVLSTHTNQPMALLGVARLSAANGRYDLARTFIEQAHQMGLDSSVIEIEKAHVDFIAGDRDNAYRILAALDNAGVKDPRILAMLTLLTAENNPLESESYLERLELYPNLIPQFSLPLARIYLSRGKTEMATRHLEHLLKNRPMDQAALQLLLRVRVQQEQVDAYMPIAQLLLQIDPRDPVANEALGKVLEKAGKTNEAEVAFAVAREARPQ